MKEKLEKFINRYGSQQKAADALGITVRTLYVYLHNSEATPRPIRVKINYLYEKGSSK